LADFKVAKYRFNRRPRAPIGGSPTIALDIDPIAAAGRAPGE
jgi:hypothetical protein